jgi:hypothetical protein
MNTKLLSTLLSLCLTAAGLAADELAKPASWSPPAAEEVRGQLEAWLRGRSADKDVLQKFEAVWAPNAEVSPGGEVLERVIGTVALVDDEVRNVVELCRRAGSPAALPAVALLDNEETPALVRDNLRLFFGAWLARSGWYDESSEMLADLQAEGVADPASLLFYQGVVHHRLLQREECLAAVSRLLENEERIAKRYRDVARLMEADIRPLRVDSLDEIARLMGDVQRRLDLGRAGQRVRRQEDEVIAKLDKLIEETEKQQKKKKAMTTEGVQSQSPAKDSMPLGGRGDGDVDQKPIGNAAEWGNLPPKEREEALQQMSKDLPAHFRELIEEYFRKLAREESG